MSESSLQQAPSGSVARAKELTSELRRLQESVESLDAAMMQNQVAKITGQIAAITEKLHSTLAKAEALTGAPDAAASTSAPAPAAPASAPASAPGGGGAVRARIDKMSGEVVDSNPYSRLMALQRMGIVKDYERIRDKTATGAPTAA
ncbi:hypothetical protein GPECTOR_36g46 [Gonium pectorale]|uniref:Uncharacterized protein n=1 Tax=Gonium pectorale TaxID=33097 RepID=A0A150GBW5_GONPE|nr:hypothetical protein GPECTOR_36g46 [Gonium pectorale]|eukprot:KXZ47322.1 hypothetical protein GPECTOR_36g46 [Gonium pectorale]